MYVPREKLKTDAGIDHDYNFLTKIERSVERAEKILREEREILPEEDTSSRPPPNKRARLHKGQSRGKVTLEENSRKWDRNSIQRMRQLGIHVSSVPYGMIRAKENKSSWNRRTRTMNWQVEWLEWKTITSEENNSKPSKMLYKILDETPLYVGFAETQEYHRKVQLSDQERAVEKKQKVWEKKRLTGGGQDGISTAWSGQEYVMQDSRTTAWNDAISGSHAIGGLKDRHRFYYLKPKTPSREQHKLIPLRPTENLASVLPGQDIVEFPTICVLPANTAAIPDGYVVENRSKKSKKRQASSLVEYASEEEGEAVDDKLERHGGDDTTSSSGSDSDESN